MTVLGEVESKCTAESETPVKCFRLSQGNRVSATDIERMRNGPEERMGILVANDSNDGGGDECAILAMLLVTLLKADVFSGAVLGVT